MKPLAPLPRAPRATPVPPTDKLIASVREAKAADQRKGTGPKVPYTPPPSTEPDTLHSALTSVGDQMLQYHDKPASLATVGHALKSVAAKIKPPNIGRSPEPEGAPEVGADTSGLFGSPAPEREAV